MLHLTTTEDLENCCCAPPSLQDLSDLQDASRQIMGDAAPVAGTASKLTVNPTDSKISQQGHQQHQQNNSTLFSASSDDHLSVDDPLEQERQFSPTSSSSSSFSSPPPSPQELPRQTKSAVAATSPPITPNSSSAAPLPPRRMGVLERAAQRCARYPKTHFWVAFLGCIALSVLAMIFGNFKVDISNVGWPSRGTKISNRQMQLHLLNRNRYGLSKSYTDCLWEDLTTVVQAGWESVSPDAANKIREEQRGCSIDHPPANRLLSEQQQQQQQQQHEPVLEQEDMLARATALPQDDFWRRHLQTVDPDTLAAIANSVADEAAENNRKNLTTILETCDVNKYLSGELFLNNRLWPIWRVKDKSKSALDPPVLKELCEAEEQTQQVMIEGGYCEGCDDGSCLPPYSPVLYARFVVPGGFVMDCSELAAAWAPYQTKTEERWKECVAYLKEVGTLNWVKDRGPCPSIFAPSLVDDRFLETGRVEYTSSIFVSASGQDELREQYKIDHRFGKGSKYLEGVYDTQVFFFLQLFAQEIVIRDAGFALGSVLVTTLAMLLHTRSPFLTLVGIIEISLSFPLAYGIYHFLGGLNYFPFLNMVGIFVSFALGADHVFVAVDKWKNARRENPNASTEEIAVMALPSSARAMSLTTTTTAVAFFGSAVCPVANIRLFAIFCGLLIIVDYIVDVIVMFPSLCIYDGYRHQRCCWVDFRARSTTGEEEQKVSERNNLTLDSGIEEEVVEDSETGKWREIKTSDSAIESQEEIEVEQNLIQRVMTRYYEWLHWARWPLCVICLAAIAVCSYFATQLKPPATPTELPLMVDKIEYERARLWRQNLLTHTMLVDAGSQAHVVWGLRPADTGDYNDPYTMTTLELDYSFDPSAPEAQVYMRNYCDNLMAADFAGPVTDDFTCPLVNFNEWLKGQSSIAPESQEEIYKQHCENASRMPVPQDSFHSCLSSWAQAVGSTDILAWNGTVRVITIPYQSRVRFDSPSEMIADEWHHVEDWVSAESAKAPPGVTKSYFSSIDFWWWDTSHTVFQTALQSGLMAIAVTAIVILISSQSLVMTFFSVVSTIYVLASVTTTMVAFGWTLGFLESICYTILIGISADFVIHFSHAYAELPGSTDRHTRTKYALLHLGPSVLAAGVTTLAGAIMMLCTIIYFFRVFAFVLFFAIIQAVVGSFVVFLVFTDCMGPSNPKYLYTKIFGRGNSSSTKSKDLDDDAKDIPGITEARTEESNDATTVVEVKAVRLSIAQVQSGEDDSEGTETEMHNVEGGPWGEESNNHAPKRDPTGSYHGSGEFSTRSV